MTGATVGVIIPFFQKEPGLLARSLLSVVRQRNAGAFRIYVIDDGSPMPVERELTALDDDDRARITIRRQTNAGPGAARNLALEILDDDIGIIAYVDSDDTWQDNHLANVRAAFDAGTEFYFSDYRREGSERTCFEKMNYAPDGALIPGAPGLHWCDSKKLFENLLMYSPIGTSTVAYSRKRFGTSRFHPKFRSAGEDKILWTGILSQLPRTAVSVNSEVHYGRGVNIYAHGSWGDERSVRTSCDCARSQTYLSRHFTFSPQQMDDNARWCRKIDVDFWAGLLAMVRRGHRLPAKLIASYLAERPSALLRLPRAFAGAFAGQLRNSHRAGAKP